MMFFIELIYCFINQLILRTKIRMSWKMVEIDHESSATQTQMHKFSLVHSINNNQKYPFNPQLTTTKLFPIHRFECVYLVFTYFVNEPQCTRYKRI